MEGRVIGPTIISELWSGKSGQRQVTTTNSNHIKIVRKKTLLSNILTSQMLKKGIFVNAAFPNYLTSGKNDELGISFVSYISSVSPSPNCFLFLDLRFVPLPTFTILQSDFAAWMVSARRISRHEGSRRQPGSNYQTVTLIFWAKSTNTILYLSLYSKRHTGLYWHSP